MVGAQQLVAAVDIADLPGGLPVPLDQDIGFHRFFPGHHGNEVAADLVVADHGDETHVGTDGDQVAQDIAGAAEHGILRVHPEHRNGRLGRDPFHGAVDEAVEHQVADHHDAGAGQGFDAGGKLVDVVHRRPSPISHRRAPLIAPSQKV